MQPLGCILMCNGNKRSDMQQSHIASIFPHRTTLCHSAAWVIVADSGWKLPVLQPVKAAALQDLLSSELS